MADPTEAFLRLVLPRLLLLRGSARVLADFDRPDEYLSHAHGVLDALCLSGREFNHVVLPQRLGPAKPLPADPMGDNAWLERVAIEFDRMLQTSSLMWSPTDVAAPGVLADLHETHRRMAYRHHYLRPVTATTLMATIRPITEATCSLAAEWPKGIVSGVRRIGADRNGNSPAKRFIGGLLMVAGLTRLAGSVPSTSDTAEFSTDVSRALQVVPNEIVALAHDIRISLNLDKKAPYRRR